MTPNIHIVRRCKKCKCFTDHLLNKPSNPDCSRCLLTTELTNTELREIITKTDKILYILSQAIKATSKEKLEEDKDLQRALDMAEFYKGDL